MISYIFCEDILQPPFISGALGDSSGFWVMNQVYARRNYGEMSEKGSLNTLATSIVLWMWCRYVI